MPRIEWHRDDGTGLSVDAPDEDTERYWWWLTANLQFLLQEVLRSGDMPDQIQQDGEVVLKMHVLPPPETADVAPPDEEP